MYCSKKNKYLLLQLIYFWTEQNKNGEKMQQMQGLDSENRLA